MTKQRKVLVVDDEKESAPLIQQILGEKFTVVAAYDGEEGIRKARSELPDLILLDIAMPGMDGIAVCEALRKHEATKHIPIVMVSGVTEVDQRIRSFTTGADDFVQKPYRAKELQARVSSKLRRIEEREGDGEALAVGNLVLNLSKYEATIGGQAVPLSVLEFNLLKYFVMNKDRVVSREQILEAVWRDAVVSDRTVDTHLVALRKKLNGFDHVLATVYGAGYVLKRPEEKGRGKT